MFIYCLEIHLALPSFSLKEKRGIIKSIQGRARNRFNIACAEVDRQDNPRVAVLGFVTVSPDKTHCPQDTVQCGGLDLRKLAGYGDYRSRYK